jgi:hypothetical protein
MSLAAERTGFQLCLDHSCQREVRGISRSLSRRGGSTARIHQDLLIRLPIPSQNTKHGHHQHRGRLCRRRVRLHHRRRQITIINGWNFYAGSDATQIGSAQYDFETVVTHELV